MYTHGTRIPVSHVGSLVRPPAMVEFLQKIDRKEPYDKAGAYAAQESPDRIIESVTGSFSNVVGLPMELTIPILAEFGIRPG